MKDHRRLAITTSILVVLLLVVGAVVAFNCGAARAGVEFFGCVLLDEGCGASSRY